MKTKSYIEKLKADARAKELDATRSKTSQDKYWQGQQDMASLILAKIKAEITSGNEVDAYLISAAPDMYEALKEVFQLHYPGEHRNDCYGEVKPSPDCQTCKIIKVRKHVIKALAKAEGK